MMNEDLSSAGNKKGKDNSGVVIKLEKGQSPREGANLKVGSNDTLDPSNLCWKQRDSHTTGKASQKEP